MDCFKELLKTKSPFSTPQFSPSTEGKFRFSGNCVISGKRYFTDEVTREEMLNYTVRGMLVQEAFPNLSRDDREFIVSGIHPKVFDEMYAEEDEEELVQEV